MSDDRTSHWETIYRTETEDQVSWFQQTPEPSLTLLGLAGATPDAAIVDIGAGASHLVDALISRGFDDVTVLDISRAALDADRAPRTGRKPCQLDP